MTNILLGTTGSVASIKLPILVQNIQETFPCCELKIIYTEKANVFFSIEGILKKFRKVKFLGDDDEWVWSKIGDPVLHVELRKWADIFAIAPCGANTLAKISSGLCDNLVTSTARCWDFTKPFLIFPAMNTYMLEHPITTKQIKELEEWGIKIQGTSKKVLACGDEGGSGTNDILKYRVRCYAACGNRCCDNSLRSQ